MIELFIKPKSQRNVVRQSTANLLASMLLHDRDSFLVPFGVFSLTLL